MAPKIKRSKRPSLDTMLNFVDGLNHHPNLDVMDDCPEALKSILLLINRTRLGHEDLDPPLEGQTFNASHIYDEQLMWRAQEMSRVCSDIGMNQSPEFEWQRIMSSHAFLSLNNKDEERTNSARQYHHCLACCRVFRPGSRPLLNATCDATAQSNAEATLEAVAPSQICDSDIHFNLPNFVLYSQLRYYYQEKERQRYGVPDATIGLCAYNLKHEPWQKQRPDLRTDPRIEPFSLKFLETIFRNIEDLKGPYPSKVLNDGVPLFAFAVWEAKKSDGDSHWSAFTQLDKKVRRLLQWQDAIINEAENDSKEFFPVVWAFTSVGSSWTVYGCYQSVNKEDEKHFGSSVELWSGNVSDKNKALQLLWIVDILKFWAEYTYKPMIGACLARIKAQVDKHDEVPLEETLWKSHITLNEEKTPWFFHQANLPHHKKSQPHNSSSGDSRPKLKFKSLSDQCSPWSSETAPDQILHRRPTLNEQQINDFTWLQDRDPEYGDLLIIRLGREGKIDKPLVLLDSEIPSSNNNSARYSGKVLSHAGVDVGLIKGKGGIYLLREHRGLFSSDHQFCAILPLEPKAYQVQRRKSNKSSIFGPLEELLDLDSLYRIYDLECSSHVDRRRPQVKDHPNDASDEEDSAESHEGSCDEDTSDDEADTSRDYDGSSDDVEEEEKEEEEEEDEEEEEEEDIDGDEDESANDDYELNISEKWNKRLENVHKAWKRHKWPNEKSWILAFARVALRLESAKTKAYKAKDGKMYNRGDEVPIDWMTPVEGFGKSFLLVKRTEKRGSLISESADNQSYEGSDREQTLVGSGDEGKKAVSKLGKKFKSLGVD